MAPIQRRTFLKAAAAVAGLAAAGVLVAPMFRQGGVRTGTAPSSTAGKIDYTKATGIPTICFGCTTHCGVVGWVQDGIVRRISGNPLDPNSEGNICSKANGMLSYTYYPERLLYPIKRVGKRGEGKWKRISWDQANDEIGGRLKQLREDGTPEEFVFHYGRDKTKGVTKHFTNSYGTPHRLNRRAICSSNRRAPLMSFYGREFEWETQDLLNTKFIVNFGANPMEAYQGGMYMSHRIMSARVDNGARMVTFEVRPSATASVSDEYYPIKPGADGAVAAAMCHVILRDNLYDQAFFERWANVSLDEIKAEFSEFTPVWAEEQSGIEATVIERIAKEFAAAAPSATTMSARGSAKHYNGMQGDRCIRLLDVLCGTVGRVGGFCLSSGSGWGGKYGQDGLPKLGIKGAKPSSPKAWLPGTREFEAMPKDVRDRVASFPEKWQKKYYGELATPSEYPLAWHWYQMRVGQLVYEYIREKRQKVSVYFSYTLGAAFGYPEAKAARNVLLDEELIPFHVAIDIGYSEQSALADIILPEATSLERWDGHGTNSYALRPYTGVRQPLHAPLGESRSIQVILRDLAHFIGGGMEQHFDWTDPEEMYKQWYSNLPIAWEDFKARGIWQDKERELDYELYERPVPESELAQSRVDEDTDVIYSTEGTKAAIGIMMDGKAIRGFPTTHRKIGVFDDVFGEAAAMVGIPTDEPLASNLPTWFPVPSFLEKGDDELHFTTFKWNVHTQGRSGHWKYAAEVIHNNPLFIAAITAQKHGLEDGDMVEVTVSRPKGYAYRAGESEPVGSFKQKVKVMQGMSEDLVAASHHVGHWEHGPIGSGRPKGTNAAEPGFDRELVADPDIAANMWWAKENGGVGHGVHMNDAMPIDPAALVGGQNWYDNLCTIRKV
jgi:thiosulfate reductase/polysulfide reductase chain A